MLKRMAAEGVGTFVLVLGGCGSAVLAGGFPDFGIAFTGIAIAFGLTVLTMAYAVGPISGGHFNPAVTLGLTIAGRAAWSDLIPYWVAQVVGGFLGAVVLYVIASGAAEWVPAGFASNGYGARSPGGYTMLSAFVCEAVMTAIFLVIILGATQRGVPPGFAPLPIGLGLTLIHLVSIPVTNTSVNPARSTAVAFFAENGAVPQLWLFWVAPLLGAAIGAVVWDRLIQREPMIEPPASPAV